MDKVIRATLLAATALAGTAALAADKSAADKTETVATGPADDAATSRGGAILTYEPERAYADRDGKWRDVPRSLADWLASTHARPAGR